jgi:hypothetical protein
LFPLSEEPPKLDSDTKFDTARVAFAVFFISFAAIGWQLGLMQCLLIARYHHFSFLVISCALLGFGAGGTILSLGGSWFKSRQEPVFRWGTMGFGLSLPICFRLGEALPLNVYFPPDLLTPTLGWWVVFWLIHCIPFLLAGMLIGLALMVAGKSAHKVYAVNLAGSATGALGGILLLAQVPANDVAVCLGLLVLVSGLILIPTAKSGSKWIYAAGIGGMSLLLGAVYLAGPDRLFPLNIDQYKALAYIQRLVRQGSAERKLTLYGPRGRVDLFSSHSFHALLSLNSVEAPPPMDVILLDGFQVGTVLDIKTPDQARFLEGTLSALPYKLVRPERVLILGEAGSIYLWLARLSSAASIVLVQPNVNVRRVLETHPSNVMADPRITVVAAEPRAFLDRTKLKFDVIHLAAMEGFSPGSGGIAGLREDYLGTVEGFSRCLKALTPGGIACVVRGIQDPARDNIKLAGTWIEALERDHAKEPGKQIVVARDELAAATLAGRSPFSVNLVRKLQSICRRMSWDLDWFPGARPEQTNRIHLLAGPEDTNVSWYYQAVKEILSPEREDFYRKWICNVRPATDDQPFFYDFFRWGSISKLRSVFGPQWPARAEMGFLVLVMATIWTAAAATVLLPGSIILLRKGEVRVPGRLIVWAAAFFAVLGTAFMFLEMSFIQMFTRFLGDPVLAAALVVGGFLFFAGLGSLSQPFVTSRFPGGVLVTTVTIAALVAFDITLFPSLFETAAVLPGVWKAPAGLAMMAPLAFLMGTPFPWGLSILHERAAAAVPLAWAVNGFASVVSACGAVLLAMTWGFKDLCALAAGLYGMAGVLSLLLCRWTNTRAGSANMHS